MKKKILFAGEQYSYPEKLQEKLLAVGCEISATFSGFGELRGKIEEYKPDILLLDFEMFETPDELNLLHLKYNIPIILLLPHIISDDKYLKKMIYVSDFLEKPIRAGLLIFSIQNIMHKLKLEETCEQNRITVSAMIDNNPHAGLIIDISGKIEYANNNFCKMINLPKYKLINRMCHEILDEIYLKNSKKIIQKILTQSIELDFVEMINGKAYDYKIIPIKKRSGEIFNIAIYIRDITKDLESENRILQLSKAMETMQLGVLVLDLDKKIRYSNMAAAKMHGYTLDEMIGKSAYDLLFGLDRRIDIEEIDLIYRRIPIETNNRRKNGEIFPAKIISDIFSNDKGEPIAIVVSCEDISYQKKIEEQLIRNERLAGISSLASGIAHEIRNPLGNISSATQFCLASLDQDSNLSVFLDIIQRNTERANKIIKELVEFATPWEIIKIPNSINKLVVNATNQLIPKFKNVQIILDLEDNLPLMYLDENWITKVFYNLIKNGCESMPDGGELRLSTYLKDDKICFTCEDNGVGIKSNIQKKIFDPFYTTKDTGVGLGLSVAQTILSKHMATLHFTSELGKGSAFEIVFSNYSQIR